ALGYLSHVASDTVAHAFVNQVAGGPFRVHWQRHHLVENHADAQWYLNDPDPTAPRSNGGYDQLTESALYAGSPTTGLRAPSAPAGAGLLTPAPVGVTPPAVDALPPAERAKLLRQRERFHRGCDGLHIPLHAFAADLAADEAQVIRVRQRIDGVLVGGYTVVLVGRRRVRAR